MNYSRCSKGKEIALLHCLKMDVYIYCDHALLLFLLFCTIQKKIFYIFLSIKSVRNDKIQQNKMMPEIQSAVL